MLTDFVCRVGVSIFLVSVFYSKSLHGVGAANFLVSVFYSKSLHVVGAPARQIRRSIDMQTTHVSYLRICTHAIQIFSDKLLES